MSYDNENRGNGVDTTYHYGPDEMRASNNNTYYRDQNIENRQERVQQQGTYQQIGMDDNQREAATYESDYQNNSYNNQMNGGYTMNDSYHDINNSYYAPNDLSDGGKKKKSGNGNKFGKVVAYAAVFGLVAGTVFQGVNYGADYFLGNNQKQNVQLQTTNTANTGKGNTVSTGGTVKEVAANAMPSIVAITSTVESVQYGFFNQEYKTEGTGSGSGIIVGKDDKNLLIATNNHVIEDATKVQVTFYHDSKEEGSGEVVEATIRGTDVDSDLAVVEVPISNISEETMAQIKVAVMGNSDEVEIGQQVVAVGNALGYGQSVTSGYISALNRQVQLEDKTMTLMQTDAAINPGNSGGALLNMNGEVIGINSAKYSESGIEGMGFAIPMATAKPILEDIMNESSIPEDQQAYLGITGQTVTEQYMKNFNMPTGVFVASVTDSSPAKEGGILQNDIIVKFNDRTVSTMDGLQSLLSRKAAGDKVNITVKRQNGNGEYEEKELTVTLGKKTESIKNQQELQSQKSQQSQNNSREYRNSQNGDDFWSFFN